MKDHARTVDSLKEYDIEITGAQLFTGVSKIVVRAETLTHTGEREKLQRFLKTLEDPHPAYDITCKEAGFNPLEGS